MSRISAREKTFLIAIIALAAFFRFYRLDAIPPGFQFDQAYYVFDAIFLLRGDFFIFFRDPGRSEPLYQYLLMPFVALFGGDTPLGLKVTAGIIGVLTIFLIYGVTRALFSPSSVNDGGGQGWGHPSSAQRGRTEVGVRIGLLAALLSAICFWHIFYCRYGERIPLTLFFATLAFWFFWRAISLPRMTWEELRVGVGVWRAYLSPASSPA